MRIQIYSGNFFPEKTGIGKYTGEMAEWLAARGHEVEVITGFPYYPEWKLAGHYSHTYYRHEQWQGVSILRVPHYIPKDGHVTSLRRVLVDLSIFIGSSVHGLRTLFSGTKPDVIIAICPPLFSGIWPWLIGKVRRVPWIYHIQDYQVDAAVRLGMLKGWIGKLLLGLEGLLVRSATRVSSITPAMCRVAASKGAAADRLMELPNWSDIRGIQPMPRDNAFRKMLGIDPAKTLVMYAGAMGRKQGLTLVLDAAERLQEDSRFHFLMVGSGSDATELQDMAHTRKLHNMTFLPLQPLERLCEMLAAGDVHLVIQRSHAADLVMPSKLTNILAAGRPCIATAERGTALWEVVHEARTGLAIPPEDAHALVEALDRLATDAGTVRNLSRNARLYAERHLDRDAILLRFEAQLADLCGCTLAKAVEAGP